MSMDYVIMGLLSLGPRTGYDLKKEISGSTVLHWSGNSNQVYKALLGLSEGGSVASETVHQEKGPTKKVFTLTPLGREQLRGWLRTEMQPPDMRNSFLVRMLFANVLAARELEALMLEYEDLLRVQVKVATERQLAGDEGAAGDARTTRDGYILAGLAEYELLMLRTELQWVRRFRGSMPAHRRASTSSS